MAGLVTTLRNHILRENLAPTSLTKDTLSKVALYVVKVLKSLL